MKTKKNSDSFVGWKNSTDFVFFMIPQKCSKILGHHKNQKTFTVKMELTLLSSTSVIHSILQSCFP